MDISFRTKPARQLRTGFIDCLDNEILLNKVELIIRLFFAEDFGQAHETFMPQVAAIILKIPEP
jgi:hypothetical protein